MTAFRFRLQTLLRLREGERRQRQLELAQAREAERILLDQIATLEYETGEVQNRVRAAQAPGAVLVDAILELQRYTIQLRAQVRLGQERLEQVRAEVERRRTIVMEADRQVRTLEKLRDKQAATFAADVLRREQAVLDELGTIGAVARESESP